MSYNLTIASCEQRLRLSYRPGGDFPDFVTRYGRTIHVHSVTVDVQRGPWPEWRVMNVSITDRAGVGEHITDLELMAVTEDSEPGWLPTLLRQAIDTADGATLRFPAGWEAPADTVPA